jgi:hypothetical protein
VITFVNLVYAGRRWHAVAIAVTGVVGFASLGTAIGDHSDPTVVGVVATAGWVGALAGAGEALRAARDRRHANQQTQAETIQRQVAEERLRIARDLQPSSGAVRTPTAGARGRTLTASASSISRAPAPDCVTRPRTQSTGPDRRDRSAVSAASRAAGSARSAAN